MKGIVFVGRSLEVIRDFPEDVKREAGYQLDRVQRGLDPVDWKPMSSIGQGVREIRIQEEGQWRVIYISRNSMRQSMFYMRFEKKHKKHPDPILKRLNEHLVK